MMRRVVAPVLLAVLASACATPLGRTVPECAGQQGGSTLVMIQAVKGTEYVPCVGALQTGWDFNHVAVRSGQAYFTLDSDRMGTAFLAVTLETSCEVGGARAADSHIEGVAQFRDVVSDTGVPIVLIPEGFSAETRVGARKVVDAVEGLRINDRRVNVSIDETGLRTSDRIQQAHAAGAHVMVVSGRDAEEGTVTLLRADSDVEQAGLSIESAIDEITSTVTEPSYRGRWYYQFPTGCITYTFDAVGPGVETLERDVGNALGLTPAEPIRQALRDVGYRLP